MRNHEEAQEEGGPMRNVNVQDGVQDKPEDLLIPAQDGVRDEPEELPIPAQDGIHDEPEELLIPVQNGIHNEPERLLIPAQDGIHDEPERLLIPAEECLNTKTDRPHTGMHDLQSLAVTSSAACAYTTGQIPSEVMPSSATPDEVLPAQDTHPTSTSFVSGRSLPLPHTSDRLLLHTTNIAIQDEHNRQDNNSDNNNIPSQR